MVSGMRQGAEIAIWLDMEKALRGKVDLFRSRNGVILTPGIDGHIPQGLFLKVMDMQSKEVLWRNGLPVVSCGKWASGEHGNSSDSEAIMLASVQLPKKGKHNGECKGKYRSTNICTDI